MDNEKDIYLKTAIDIIFRMKESYASRRPINCTIEWQSPLVSVLLLAKVIHTQKASDDF